MRNILYSLAFALGIPGIAHSMNYDEIIDDYARLYSTSKEMRRVAKLPQTSIAEKKTYLLDMHASVINLKTYMRRIIRVHPPCPPQLYTVLSNCLMLCEKSIEEMSSNT